MCDTVHAHMHACVCACFTLFPVYPFVYLKNLIMPLLQLVVQKTLAFSVLLRPYARLYQGSFRPQLTIEESLLNSNFICYSSRTFSKQSYLLLLVM